MYVPCPGEDKCVAGIRWNLVEETGSPSSAGPTSGTNVLIGADPTAIATNQGRSFGGSGDAPVGFVQSMLKRPSSKRSGGSRMDHTMADALDTAGFNLVDESWLPVRRRSGSLERIPPSRINDRIGEDPFIAFAWPRPDFNGAAHEFLIGLLSTAAAPMDDEDWEDWWLNPPDAKILERRFARISHAFDLDGPGPRFLQDMDSLEGAEEKDASALIIDAPGENTKRNNADLFVKRGGVSVMGRAAAAMALYTLSAYAPSGGAGHRTSLRGGGPLTTLVVASHGDYGDTLWGRLWPNVESEEQISARATEAVASNGPEAIFPWLVPTRTSNRKDGGRPTTPTDVHPLQVYWGMPRRIRLLFEDAQNRLCGVTGAADSVVATSFRTRTTEPTTRKASNTR